MLRAVYGSHRHSDRGNDSSGAHLGRGSAAWLWLAVFLIATLSLSRGYPLPLFAHSAPDQLSVQLVQRVDVPSGRPIAVDTGPSGTGEGVLVVRSEGESHAAVQWRDAEVDVPLKRPRGETSLLAAAGGGIASVSWRGTRDVATVTARADTLAVDTWESPRGLVGEILSDPAGPVLLTTAGPPLPSLPVAFTAPMPDDLLSGDVSLQEEVWFIRGGRWPEEAVLLPETLFLAFDLSPVVGRGVALGLPIPVLSAAGERGVEVISFDASGLTERIALEGLRSEDAAGSRLRVNPATREILIAGERTLVAFSLEGGDRRWEFSLPLATAGDAQIVDVAVDATGRSVVACGRHLHFLAPDGRRLGRVSPGSEILALAVAGAGEMPFAALTGDAVHLYDSGGRLMWSENFPDRPQLARMIPPNGRAERGKYRLLVATRESVYEYRIELNG